jgi:hypothetical protein
MLLLVPTIAQAHGHRWDVGGGPSSGDGSRLWGGRASIGLTSKKPANEDFSILLDLTNLKDREEVAGVNQDTTLIALFVGGRYAIIPHRRYLVTVHGLLGFVDKHKAATGNTDLAFSTGAAFDLIFTGANNGWAARVQVDRTFLPEDTRKGYTQVSVGLVKRFDW